MSITRVSEDTIEKDGLFIPMDPSNRHYAAILKSGEAIPELSGPDPVIAARDECTAIINKMFPDWQQRNMLATQLQHQVRGDVPPATLSYIQSVWDWVKAMRAESNAAPAERRDPVWPKFPAKE